MSPGRGLLPRFAVRFLTSTVTWLAVLYFQQPLPGAYLVTLTVTNDLGLTSTETQAATVPCPAGDLTPWTAADIGAPGFPGSASRDGDCFSFCAGGIPLAGKTDKLHFVYQEFEGDFVLTSRIEEMEGAPLGALFGLMARESPEADSAMAAVGITLVSTSANFRLWSRSAVGGSVVLKSGAKATLPAWIRLERKGDELIGWSSADGVTWTEVKRVTLTLANPSAALLVGLFGIGERPVAGTFESLRGRACLEAGLPQARFRRGDTNADGDADISDAVATLTVLFLGTTKFSCQKAADTNDDSTVDISDAVFLLSYLFLGEKAPNEPLGSCGVDPTPDELTCESFQPCQ